MLRWIVRGIAGTALGMLLALPACSPSSDAGAGEESAQPTPAASGEEAAQPPGDALSLWLKLWGPPDPDAPMYRRLPVGVDTRGWEPMTEGFGDWLKGGKPFNRPASDNYRGHYQFTGDFFSWNIPLWRQVLAPLVGRPELRYLEIGIAEGRSLLWMLENVLTHPSSRATGIDPFLIGGTEQRFRENLEASGASSRVEVIKGFSEDVLPGLEPRSYDLIYIDGSHLAGDVLEDAVLTWRLLRAGGLVIHDDYMWKYDDEEPPDVRPMVAVDAFITGHRNEVEVLHRGRQVILRKLPLEIPESCWNQDPCLRVGRYLYAWNSRKLHAIDTGETVPLTKAERAVLLSLLRARRFGADAELLLEEDVRGIRARHPREFERLVELMDVRVVEPPRLPRS